MRLFFSLFLLTAIIALPITGKAQTNDQPSPPKALESMIEEGAQIYFLGEYEGMNGWVLIRQGKPEFFYENPDRTAVVMGFIFNEEGDMVTMAQLSSLKKRVGDELYATTGTAEDRLRRSRSGPISDNNAAQPAPTQNNTEQQQTETATAPEVTTTTPTTEPEGPAATRLFGKQLTDAEKMFVDVVQSNWVTINPDGNHDVFAFIDPDCVHCQEFIRTSDGLTEEGNIRIRVIPIGVNSQSAARAAVLLASANPEERLKNYANGDTSALPAPQNIGTGAIEDNTNLMLKHNFDVTPVVVYRTTQGKIRLIRGRPTDYDMMIRDIREN